MIKKFANACVRIVNRWLPDAFLFAVILSIIVFIAAMSATGLGPVAMLEAWGSDSGFWSLLGFAMQMALILVLGSPSAFSPAAVSSSGPSSDKPETHKHRSAGGSPLPPIFLHKSCSFFLCMLV